MRIVIIGLNYLPEPTGIAPYTAGLASGLVEDGHEVRVITTYPHYPAWSIADGYRGSRIREVVDGVPLTRLRPYVVKNPTGIRRLMLEMHFGMKAALTPWGRSEAVVLVSPALFATAILQARARLTWGRPAILIWVQDIYSLGVAETGALGAQGASVMSRVESFVMRSADRVVVIHERFKQVLVSALGVRSETIEVVRNWTHIRPSSVDRDQYRAKFGWGSETIVLHAGNMGAKQALENVVEAARLADAVGAEVRFVLLGNGNQRDSLIDLARDVERLEIIDSLNDQDFQGAMAAADILLVNEKPGVTEMAVPSKLTSYFAAQRPVIAATDEGSITASEIAAARAGVRVNAGNPELLLEAVTALGTDAELSAELGRNGADFQSRVLSAENARARFGEIFATLSVNRRE
jgi:colanic acid biosynthesis glycosyl transferase WcaI